MTVVSAKMIKSASRALQVLEYLNAERQSASMTDFARDLGYPLSSASELLHCMVTLGYLDYDTEERRYQATAKVALLGTSVQPELFRHGRLVAMMDEIGERTGELVALSRVIGLSVQYIYSVAATNPVCLRIPHEHNTSLVHSAHGQLLLSKYQRTRLDHLVRRINSEEQDFTKHVKVDELNAKLAHIRRQGYALSMNAVAANSGMVALLIRTTSGDSHMAVGVGGVSNVIAPNAKMYLEIIYDAAVNHGLAEMIEYYAPGRTANAH